MAIEDGVTLLLRAFVLMVVFVFLFSGCIRLWGGAGYVKEAPREKSERVVGFDTAQLFEDRQTKGIIAT